MGFCEKKVVLASQLGRRETDVQQAAQQAGIAAHAEFHGDAKRVIAQGGRLAPRVADRCFIATALYGADARETWALREFRDAVLSAKRLKAIVTGIRSVTFAG